MEVGTVAALGLICGSFANVVVVRLPKRESLVRPGSRCPNCNTPLRWWQNIPVLSYLMLRGRCRACRERISPRYPVIEVLTSVLFVAAGFRENWDPLILAVRAFPLVVILISITFIDLELRIIPDELSL